MSYWTVERVKDKLPSVKIQDRSKKHTYLGTVNGRLQQFATVHFGDGYTATFSWESIVRALNTGRTLQY